MSAISSVRPAEIKIQAMFRGQQSRNQQLFEAAESGDISKVKNLLVNRANINATDKHGMTALYIAAKAGKTEVVEELVKAGADVNVKNKYGLTALHSAASRGYEEIVKALVIAGADVNAKESEGWTALHEAAFYGYAEIVKALVIAGADVNATNNDGKTVLHVAVMNVDNLKIVRVLLDKGANVNAKNSDGNTALHVASVTAGFCEDIIEELVIAGAKIDAINNIGKTALDRAIYFGSSHFSRSMKNAIEEGKKKLISLYKNQQLQFEKAVNSPIHECELLREPLLQNAPKNLNETQIQQAIKYIKEQSYPKKFKRLGNIKSLIKNTFGSKKFCKINP